MFWPLARDTPVTVGRWPGDEEKRRWEAIPVTKVILRLEGWALRWLDWMMQWVIRLAMARPLSTQPEQ